MRPTLWTGYHTVVSLLLMGAFAGVTVIKIANSLDQSPTRESETESTDSLQQTARFWNVFQRATEARTSDDLERAVELYRRALERRPEHPDAAFYLGSVLARSGQLGEAEAIWSRLSSRGEVSARTEGQLASLRACSDRPGQRDLQQAKHHLRTIIRAHGEETQPLLRLAEIYVLEDSLDRAREMLDALSGRDEQPASAHFLRGYLAWRVGRSDEATVLLAKARSAQRSAETDETSRVGRLLPEDHRAPTCRVLARWPAFLSSEESGSRPGNPRYRSFHRQLRESIRETSRITE